MGPLAAHPDPKTQEEMLAFLADYMPMKYGSSLMSKVRKTNRSGQHYWEMDQARDKPFVLAIADFHKPATRELGSMTFTQSAIWQYLYGRRVAWDCANGRTTWRPVQVASHQYGGKTVPSGFFDQPGAEHISAVLFSNAGTLAKFDRMGVVAGFGAPNHRYFRMGLKLDADPNALMGKPFSIEVTDPTYDEYWSDELQVFHNHNAKQPLPMEWLGGVTHHKFENGDIHSYGKEGRILSSYTIIVKSSEREAD